MTNKTEEVRLIFKGLTTFFPANWFYKNRLIMKAINQDLNKKSNVKKVIINPGKVQPIDKIWLSREEAMAFLGCADDYLRKVRESGQVSFCRDGRMVWYNVNSLQRYIEKHKVI